LCYCVAVIVVVVVVVVAVVVELKRQISFQTASLMLFESPQKKPPKIINKNFRKKVKNLGTKKRTGQKQNRIKENHLM